jgi:hypothetical protein
MDAKSVESMPLSSALACASCLSASGLVFCSIALPTADMTAAYPAEDKNDESGFESDIIGDVLLSAVVDFFSIVVDRIDGGVTYKLFLFAVTTY